MHDFCYVLLQSRGTAKEVDGQCLPDSRDHGFTNAAAGALEVASLGSARTFEAALCGVESEVDMVVCLLFVCWLRKSAGVWR